MPSPTSKEQLIVSLGSLRRKRIGPPTVEPVTLDGVRYEALHWGRTRGFGQNGGYLIAIDDASDAELWVARVYGIDYLPALETDVQDVFVRSVEVTADKHELLITDERGRRFGFDIARRVARAIDLSAPSSRHESQPSQVPALPEQARRLAPRRVEPVVGHGVRYEILHGALARGFGQCGGVIAAIDVVSGKELWILQVYVTQQDPDEELDAQEVFITEMAIDAAAGVLLLKNERHQSFRVNLADRSVAQDA